MDKLHLICNAHLDPVWLWEWEEGAAEAISTFRVAADFCEQFDGFVFNHNEVVLYQWVQEYEPALFRRIQRLVRKGRWHIMGGWYLQPDCNMPSGESFVRQGLVGRRYFKKYFGVTPTTAINFDPFGHSRGLVQILRKLGYDSYLICRPTPSDGVIAEDDFLWIGLDGSEISVHRESGWYNSQKGKARERVEKRLNDLRDRSVGMVLWGVGNHGGGPSRIDLEQLSRWIASTPGPEVIHSTPEAFFRDCRAKRNRLPKFTRDLNPSMVGCYTSQIRIKQKHRRLENELYMVEKMASSAALQGLLAYPREEVGEAAKDLLFAEFHDILPGTTIQPAEDKALQVMEHGLEILSRVKARTFFALAAGQPAAAENEIPIFAFNPHPFPVKGIFECEFQPSDQNWKDEFNLPIVHADGHPLPCQAEQELSNINLDWRKRSVFAAELAPMQMSRFDVRLQVVPRRPVPQIRPTNGKFIFKTNDLDVVVNAKTGLIDKYAAGGTSFLQPGSFLPLVIEDNEDPWGMNVKSFRNVAGKFRLMTPREAARFAGVHARSLAPVRVIEDGEVRTVIEALFTYGDSFICHRYKLPKQGAQIEVEVRVHWNEKNRMLKLSVPTVLRKARYLGQTAFGIHDLPTSGDELVAQKWVAAVASNPDLAFTCINDGTYGSDFADGELRLSLLRAAAYSAHPIGERPVVVQDRCLPRIDQGERLFTFWFEGGPAKDRLETIDREALVRNEKPFLLSFFPAGTGTPPLPAVILDDRAIQLAAFKKAEGSDDFILRLFEPTGKKRTTTLRLPSLGIKRRVHLKAFEIKTFRVNRRSRTLREVGLLEE